MGDKSRGEAFAQRSSPGGIELSMKNIFAVLPRVRNRWPDYVLQWRGILQIIVNYCATVPIYYATVDAIMAIEGNGPLA